MPILTTAPEMVASSSRFSLKIPVPRTLTSLEDLSLSRKAYELAPQSEPLRYQLASQLTKLDHFDEAVMLLRSTSKKSRREWSMLATALIGHETQESDHCALEAAQEAVRLCETPQQIAFTLAVRAKVLTRLQRREEAMTDLRAALKANPNEKDGYKRLFRLLLDQDPQAALQLAKDTIDAGVVHSRVLGSLALALCALGRFEEARIAEGSDSLSTEIDPAPPDHWEDQEAFVAALADEALHHPDVRYDRYGVASAYTWRLDEPTIRRTPRFLELQTLIRREVELYAEKLRQKTHPWVDAVPRSATLRNWCVITEGEGYETWHVHQNGWMSGVFYIHVQDHIAEGVNSDGCIAFGLPDEVIGVEAAAQFGEKMVRPHTGMMMMFPSHCFHRTYPHHGPGKRICYAFDIIPN